MPGYEDLTADQIITITYLIIGITGLQIVGRVISDLIRLRTAKLIKFKVEREIVKNIQDELTKERRSFFTIIKEWWQKRKQKESDPFDKYVIKPIEEVKTR